VAVSLSKKIYDSAHIAPRAYTPENKFSGV
jgi:hypothetical protein